MLEETETKPFEPWLNSGIPTFPCHPDSKTPACRSWRPKTADGRTRSLSLQEGQAHWSALGDRGAAMMVGLDCEALGVVVIDLDVNKPGNSDVDGVSEFTRLCRRYEIDVESCLTVRTPSGGRHLYFADPTKRWGNTTSVLAPGIDTRGVGGFVVAPGSKRADGAYHLVEPAELNRFIDLISNNALPPPPAALASLLDATCLSKNRKLQQLDEEHDTLAARPVSRHASPPNSELPMLQMAEHSTNRWTLSTAEAAIAAAKVGTRNSTMSSVAFTMGLRATALALSREAVVEGLLEAARKAGWDDDETKTRDTAVRQFDEGFAKAIAQGQLPSQVQGPAVAVAITHRNVLRTTEQALAQSGISACRDLFRNLTVIENAPGGVLPTAHEGPISDSACRWLAKWMRDNLVLSVTWSTVNEALSDLAEHNAFNPVVDWLDKLHWDGVPRLDTWLPLCVGADPTPLACAAGALVLRGMVMRARWPGSKFDSCLVLEGPQGLGKSSLVAAMCEGPGWGYFCDAPGLLGMDGKARGEQIRGKWAVEVAELAGLRRKEAEEIKAFLSLTADQYRPAYGRNVVEQLRTAVFIGTTNAPEYLHDVTGNRRFVPVACKVIDLSWFRQHRDQLFAEADARLRALVGNAKQGRPLPSSIAEKLALPRELWADLEELTEDRREASTLEILLPDVLADLSARPPQSNAKGRYITATDLMNKLNLVLPRMPSTSGLATQMKRLGWDSGRAGKDGRRVYYAPASATSRDSATGDRVMSSKSNRTK